jgi:hypothetical protein
MSEDLIYTPSCRSSWHGFWRFLLAVVVTTVWPPVLWVAIWFVLNGIGTRMQGEDQWLLLLMAFYFGAVGIVSSLAALIMERTMLRRFRVEALVFAAALIAGIWGGVLSLPFGGVLLVPCAMAAGLTVIPGRKAPWWLWGMLLAVPVPLLMAIGRAW